MTGGAARSLRRLLFGLLRLAACLDRLEKAGHIRRSRDAADRRVVHVHYETGARPAARRHFMPLAEATSRAIDRFDEQELATALRDLKYTVETQAPARAGRPWQLDVVVTEL